MELAQSIYIPDFEHEIPATAIPELPSWDFLESLDVEASNTDNFRLPESAKAEQAKERLKEKNRQAQKRARQRNKAKSQDMAVQLDETTAQLHELKLKQKQLEQRNFLLEKVAALNKQQAMPYADSSWLQEHARDTCLAALERAGLKRTQQGSAIVLTATEPAEEIQLEHFSQMSVLHFAKLYTAYVHKLAQCLVDLDGSDDLRHSANAQMQQWRVEMMALFLCFVAGNPKVKADLLSLNMEDGTMHEDRKPISIQDDLLAACDYTDSQVQDMLHLRRVFYGKLGQLLRQRDEILQQQPKPGLPEPFNLDFKYAAMRDKEALDFTNRLTANRAEENRTYIYTGMCFFCVQSSLQQAVSVLRQYPYVMDINLLLEGLAKGAGEPEPAMLMQPSGVDDLQLVANWEPVVQYVEKINADGMHHHLSFLQNFC